MEKFNNDTDRVNEPRKTSPLSASSAAEEAKHDNSINTKIKPNILGLEQDILFRHQLPHTFPLPMIHCATIVPDEAYLHEA